VAARPAETGAAQSGIAVRRTDGGSGIMCAIRLPEAGLVTSTSKGGGAPFSHWRRRRVRVLIVALAAVAALELLRAAFVATHLVNEDTSLLWVAARDWAHGRIPQPNFYGQSYGSTLESIPIALLHAVRVPYWTATPLVLAAIEWFGWVVLAIAALRRRRRVMAAAALAMPIVLSGYHGVYATLVPDAPLPRLLVVSGVAILVARPERDVTLAGAALLLGLGIQFDASAALLALPVCAWWWITSFHTRRQLAMVIAGALPAAALFVYAKAFYALHPDYAFHPAPSLRARGSILGGSASHLGAFFRLYAPEVWRFWPIPALAFGGLVVALLTTRKLAYALPAALSVLVVLYGMATPKAATDLGMLLPRGRILLALPATLWFLTLLTVEAGLWESFTRRVSSRLVFATLITVCLASSTVRFIQFDSRVGSWRTRAETLHRQGWQAYGFESRTAAVNGCRDDIDLARRTGIGLIVYSDRVSTYVCAALGPDVETITPSYERRTWLLYKELTRPRTSLMVTDVGPGWCELVASRARCSYAAGRATMQFPAQPVLPLLASTGVNVRGFGHGCHPVTTFAVFCRGRHADLTRHPFGSPPAVPEEARRAIVTAFRDMLVLRPDIVPLASVEHGTRYTDVASALRSLRATGPPPYVGRIVFLDDHEATVDFRVGTKALTGEALISDGRWKVATSSFCAAVVETFAENNQMYGSCDTTRFDWATARART
jgi:hypothetical protein